MPASDIYIEVCLKLHMSTEPFYPADEQAPFSILSMKAVSDILRTNPSKLHSYTINEAKKNLHIDEISISCYSRFSTPFQIYAREVSVLDGRLIA